MRIRISRDAIARNVIARNAIARNAIARNAVAREAKSHASHALARRHAAEHASACGTVEYEALLEHEAAREHQRRTEASSYAQHHRDRTPTLRVASQALLPRPPAI